MTSEPVVNRDQISLWIRELESKLEELEKQASLIEAQRRDVRRQLELLRELIGDRQEHQSRTDETGTTFEGRPTRSNLEISPSPTHGSRFRDVLLTVLRESSEPMHLVEIRSALAARGVPIPGRGEDANIVAHLRRLPGIYRVSRGTYGTAPPESVMRQPAAKRRRRRRKMRRTSEPQRSTSESLTAGTRIVSKDANGRA